MLRQLRVLGLGLLQDFGPCSNRKCGADIEKVRSSLAGLRFHDLRHHAITELAEQASDSTIMAIAGHVSPKMLAHYSHVRLQAKRAALDALSLTRPERTKATRNLSGLLAEVDPNLLWRAMHVDPMVSLRYE